MRILAVDDEASVRELLEDFLTSKGYDVECVGDGPAALDALKERPPDLLLLDLMMPGMTGMQVLRRLPDVAGDVPVIVVTAVTDEEIGRAALAAGAKDFITKPIDLQRLEEVVTAALLPGQA